MRIFLEKNNCQGRPAAFLDRDGTINRNIRGEYIVSPNQFDFYKYSIPALRLMTEKGYQIIVLSNHSGIGRGYMSLETAKEINLGMAMKFRQEGIAISGIYICPHLPNEGCACRKPLIGMLNEAINDLSPDLHHSFIAGDSSGDLKLAKAAGLPGYLVLTGAGRYTAQKHSEAKKYGTLLALSKDIPDMSAESKDQT